jgi:L-threonylcarbamoyladenylate synthase
VSGEERRIRVDPIAPSPEAIARGAEAIRRGELVAFPTETVYGLGANGLDRRATERIFLAKGRPSDNPLILHVPDVEGGEAVAVWDGRARELARAFCPGPLTLVLPARPVVPETVRAGLPSVAVRIPAHPVALALLRASGLPVAAPSANRSGRPSPTDADAVEEDLGEQIAVLLDAGPTRVGVESTVVDATGPRLVLLRPGGLPAEAFLPWGGLIRPDSEEIRRRSPGTRHRHYAPRIPVLLWDPSRDPGRRLAPRGPRRGTGAEARLGYVGILPAPLPVALEIRAENPEAYARILFAALRRAERSGISCCIAELPENEGWGGRSGTA